MNGLMAQLPQTREQFFDILHGYIASKYNLDPSDIAAIRTYSLKYNLSRKEIVFLCIKKLKSLESPKRIKRQERIINFLASCSHDAWMEVTEKTAYDRNILT